MSKKIKLELSPNEMTTLLHMKGLTCYPNLLEKLEETRRKAFEHRWSYLVIEDFKARRWRLMFSRIKNFKTIRARYA